MKISTSELYYHPYDCVFEDCERRYCREHRLLYRDCDSAYRDSMGDSDVINGTTSFWASHGECPKCIQEAKVRRFKELQERMGERYVHSNANARANA